ncbi:hypothetical protein BKA80DRAFT_262283 [Phyllosticta citrichinensis]
MNPLARTSSAESTRPRHASHSLPAQDLDSMPPPTSKPITRQSLGRRPSKASDICLPSGPSDVESSDPQATSAIEDDAAPAASLQDKESNRMSFSSLYSLGSQIYNSARNSGGPSSVAGSEPDGMSSTKPCSTCANPLPSQVRWPITRDNHSNLGSVRHHRFKPRKQLFAVAVAVSQGIIRRSRISHDARPEWSWPHSTSAAPPVSKQEQPFDETGEPSRLERRR